jgi:carbon starvation protein
MFDNALAITLIAVSVLIVAYFTYGRFLAHRVFRLDGHRRTPAHTLRDGVDFLPTKTPVLFGHHFASIAGLGPIVGPAVAVYWGWLPAILWIVAGSILAGAVHDLGALYVSTRYRGRSIGDICRELVGPRARLLFLLVIFFAMSLAMGVFCILVANLFVLAYPTAIIPSIGLMFVAVAVGVFVYKMNGSLTVATILGLSIFGGLIVVGVEYPIAPHEMFVSPETTALIAEVREQNPSSDPRAAGSAMVSAMLTDAGHTDAARDVAIAADTSRSTIVYLLLGYAFIASVLPVWLLLQPRDYINSFQLYVAVALLFAGIVASAWITTSGGESLNTLRVAAFRNPVELEAGGAWPLMPFLFVTVACGAISGFHSLVSSGTTARQLNRETDALPIGYGGMLAEGGFAVLVVMACVAGLGAAAWTGEGTYMQGFSQQTKFALTHVVTGGANYLALLGVPINFAAGFLAVTLVAFALTTLDSGTRLLRYNVEEIFRSLGLDPLANRYLASLLAVAAIGGIALLPQKNREDLWLLFGATNQLLASLTLLAVSVFLFKLGRPVVYTLVPMVCMLVVTTWAMVLQAIEYYHTDKIPNLWISVILLVMSLWVVIEAGGAFLAGRTGLVLDDERHPHRDPELATSPHVG